MHSRKPHAPERPVSACCAQLFAAIIRHPASATPTFKWSGSDSQTHSPASTTKDQKLPSELVNFEDLRLKHEVQTTVRTTFFSGLQELWGLLPGCFFSFGWLLQGSGVSCLAASLSMITSRISIATCCSGKRSCGITLSTCTLCSHADFLRHQPLACGSRFCSTR